MSNNKATFDIPPCWGVSIRDVERNGTRNSEHVDFLFDETDGVSNVEFIYQYCGHENRKGKCVHDGKHSKADDEYACRKITAVIAGFPGGTFSPVAKERILSVAKRLSVPAYLVFHNPHDSEHNHGVDYEVVEPNGKTRYVGDAFWRDGLLNDLLEEQEVHVDNEHNCVIDLPDTGSWWLDGNIDNNKVKDKGTANSSKASVDLTLSGILRVIPGVRHLDMDGCVTCDKCNEPLLLIEASTDGYSRGKLAGKTKTAAMTLRIASALDVPTIKLLHDLPKNGNVDFESGCDITIWKSGQLWDNDGKSINVTGRDVDMNDALDYIDDVLAAHNAKQHP